MGRKFPLWVTLRRRPMSTRCPLLTQSETYRYAALSDETGHQRTHEVQHGTRLSEGHEPIQYAALMIHAAARTDSGRAPMLRATDIAFLPLLRRGLP
jgi:hypothetical protein